MSEAPISARPHAFYIRPAPGWLEMLHEEVAAVVASPLQKYKFEPKITALKGAIKVHRCDWRQGLEVMTRLTTAHDVEWLVLESKCTRWPEVDAILARVPWDDILPTRDEPVHVTTDVSGGFSNSPKKLRENFCGIAGVTHASEGAEFRFKVELRGDFLRISVSLCGAPLYQRGYKTKLAAAAPLTEHQAAACVNYALDDSEVGTVYVPFAGSGTFGFEALIALAGAGPGSFARRFACDRFPCTPQPTMGFLRRKLAERLAEPNLPKVVFNDFNADALAQLRENVAAFPSKAEFEILEGDAFALRPQFSNEGKVLVLLNPPYGERLAGASDIPKLYARLGAYVRELGDRTVGACLAPDERSWSKFLETLGREGAETHHFTHGGKPMRVVRWR